jgi:hypothetical protein
MDTIGQGKRGIEQKHPVSLSLPLSIFEFEILRRQTSVKIEQTTHHAHMEKHAKRAPSFPMEN